jgi:hypothetical protein
MSDDFLLNASTEGLSPLGTAPQRSYELISGTVAELLGAEHAALFAEPVSSEHGDRSDWYAPLPGTPKRLADLPEPDQVRARAEQARLASDIRALADRLSESVEGDDQRLGEALANALEVPDEGSVWVITDLPGGRLQPVLVNWAWVRDRQRSVRGALSGADTRPSAPPPSPPVAPPIAPRVEAPPVFEEIPVGAPPLGESRVERRGSLRWLLWLGWLILAAMIAAILSLALAPCALRLPGLPARCPVAEESTLTRERLVLEDRLQEAERRLQTADRACQPRAAALVDLPPLPPELAAPPSEADSRIEDSGARRGDLTFTLTWDSLDDLDLFVTCPAGQTVSYRARAACGGALDVDSNARATDARPIENVYFNDPPGGVYQIGVDYFKSRTGGAARAFEVQIRDKDEVQTMRGTVSPADPTWRSTYQTRGQ